MVVLAISGITLTAAVPAFQAMIARNRVAAETNDMLLAINLARSEALKTGSTASVQAVDGSDSNNEFGPGYCVVDGSPGNCDTPIRMFSALTAGDTLNSVDDVTTMTFNSLGGLNSSTALKLDLCGSGVDGSRIVISLVGRSKSHGPDDLTVADRPSC
ncbi:MAG TPA: GspH/FimT family pseudopilin [Pseudomonadales bacterium]|nr:GspH/FimT family pseudopilin [Pseudomonadales bacterium]